VLKPSYLIAAAVVVIAIIGFYKLGHQATKTSNTVAAVITTPPALAGNAVADQDLQQAAQAMQAYSAEHGGYAGASALTLRTYDAGLSPTIVVVSATDTAYCLQDTIHGQTAHATGPSAIAAGPCP
jgi:hypothetical protein